MSNTTFTFDATIISDLHKDARGFRPSQDWMADFREASDERKQQIWDNLCRELEEELDREKQEEMRSIERFNTLVQNNIAIGAGDETTAIRWIIESLNLDKYDLQYGGGYVCFRLHLPYSFESKLNPICKELLASYEEETIDG